MVLTQIWTQLLQHSLVEGAVNLLKRLRAREVHQNKRSMPQEPRRQRVSPCIGRRVTSTHKLDSFETNPLLVLTTPETVLLGELPQKSDDNLCVVLVCFWQIDLITEDG